MWYHGVREYKGVSRVMARCKGSGRIFERAGRWYIRWRHEGRECTRSTGISVEEKDSKKRALEMLEEATAVFRIRDKASRLAVVKRMLETTEEEIKDRIAGIRRDARLADLEGIFRNSSFRIDCSAKQLEVYCRYIHTLAGAAGAEVRVNDIDAKFAETLVKRMSSTWSPNTYNKHLNGLAVVWKAVTPIVGCPGNPWTALPRKRLDTNVRRTLTDEEIERVFAEAKGEDRILFAIGLYTGLRLGDAVKLSWNNIEGDIVRLTTGKTGANVAIPLHPRLREAIGIKRKDANLLCPSLCAMYRRSGSGPVARRIVRLFNRCGIATSVRTGKGVARPLCGFHSLRHTFVSRCAAAGVDRAVIQALVGHSSARMTEHYTHLADRDFLAAFSRIS
jgi:integrase